MQNRQSCNIIAGSWLDETQGQYVWVLGLQPLRPHVVSTYAQTSGAT